MPKPTRGETRASLRARARQAPTVERVDPALLAQFLRAAQSVSALQQQLVQAMGARTFMLGEIRERHALSRRDKFSNETGEITRNALSVADVEAASR